jgi:hypothetical protein
MQYRLACTVYVPTVFHDLSNSPSSIPPAPCPHPTSAQGRDNLPAARRSYSGSQSSPRPCPLHEAGCYYPADEYAVEIRTQPATKQGVFTTLVNFARGRSKSRGRNEPDPTARPRSRGSFVDDGHDRDAAGPPPTPGTSTTVVPSREAS